MNREFQEIIIGVKRAVALLNKQEKTSLCIAVFIMFATGILTNVPAVVLGKLVDQFTYLNKIQFNTTIPYLALIIVAILVREGLTVIRKYLLENIATQVDKEQTLKVIERLLKTDIGNFLYKQQLGSLNGRVFRSIQGLIRILKLTFLDFMPIFFTAIAAIGIALFQKPLLAFVMILVIPSSLYLIVKQVSSQKGIRVALLRGKERIDGKVVEMLGGIETIRVLNTTAFEMEKIEEIAENQRRIEIKHHIYMALFDAIKYLNEGFIYIVVIVLSLYFASLGVISKGDILVYSILFMSITGPLREIHRILDQAHESSLQVNDFYDLLHQPLDISFEEKDSKISQKQINKASVISVKNLSFSYNNGTNTGIIENISLDIKRGENVGIVGVSGCGKTTFIHLLLKLTHGYKGEIKLFDKNLLDVTREDIAKTISYVPQKPFIFSGTIKENILYGVKRNISQDKLIAAAKCAHIHEEILKNLGGYSGLVSENGNNLSGGQRQRLAIARVMLQLPELIIFDEATSALDNANEAIIQHNIEKEFLGKTVISIAHRLTTLKNMDRIFVFDQGKIVQTGNFSALSEKKGLFQDFLNQRVKIF